MGESTISILFCVKRHEEHENDCDVNGMPTAIRVRVLTTLARDTQCAHKTSVKAPHRSAITLMYLRVTPASGARANLKTVVAVAVDHLMTHPARSWSGGCAVDYYNIYRHTYISVASIDMNGSFGAASAKRAVCVRIVCEVCNALNILNDKPCVSAWLPGRCVYCCLAQNSMS